MVRIFAEILEIYNGRSQKDVENPSGAYPIYGSGGIMGYADRYICPPNTIVLGRKGSINNPIFVDRAFWNVDTAFGLVANQEMLRPKYLYYFCRYFDFEKLNTTVTIPSLTKANLQKISLDLPPLSEQDTIISRMELVETLIALYRQQLTKLDELINARFIEMFGEPMQNQMKWPQVQLSEVIREKASNGYFAKREEYTNTGNASVLGVANVVNRMYSQCDRLPKTNMTYENIKKYKLQYGDLLFCRSSLVAEGIGKASIVPKDVPDNTVFECHVIRVPLDVELCIPEFIQVLTTTDFFRHQILKHAKTATMTTISQDGILNTKVILPQIHIQKAFYAFVTQVEKSKAAVQSALDKAQLLFDSLMQKYFG